jgi:hypothetical protein
MCNRVSRTSSTIFVTASRLRPCDALALVDNGRPPRLLVGLIEVPSNYVGAHGPGMYAA